MFTNLKLQSHYMESETATWWWWSYSEFPWIMISNHSVGLLFHPRLLHVNLKKAGSYILHMLEKAQWCLSLESHNVFSWYHYLIHSWHITTSGVWWLAFLHYCNIKVVQLSRFIWWNTSKWNKKVNDSISHKSTALQ